jgi:outer membrane protein assembly factor BamB
MKTIRAIAIILVLLATSSVFAADWPQYLGPTRNAVSSEKGLLRAWPADGPKVLWTVPLGEGFGGPAISEGKVYIYDRAENKTNILRCLDLATGKEEWNFSFEATGTIDHNGSRSTPAIDGDRIYICDPFGNFHCIDKKTHKALWQKNIWKDFGGADVPRWAIAQNPLVYQNMVIVASQTDKAGLVAYDKQTGNIIWKTDKLPGSAGYVSPMMVKINGEDHLVMISAQGRGMGGGMPPAGQGAPGGAPGSAPAAGQGAPGGPGGSAPAAGQGAPGGAPGSAPAAGQGPPAGGGAAPTGGTPGAVIGYNPKTGALLWSYTGWQCSIPCNNVTEIGNNRLFVTGGYNAGSAIIQIEKVSNSYTVKELLKSKEFGTHVHPAIFYKDHLYGNCTTNDVRDGMVCMDLKGNVKWKTKTDPLFDKGGFILVDDMIINNNGEGMFYLIEPTPAGFKMLSKAKLVDSKEAWAPLALSDGKLIVRDQKQMKCVQVK